MNGTFKVLPDSPNNNSMLTAPDKRGELWLLPMVNDEYAPGLAILLR